MSIHTPTSTSRIPQPSRLLHPSSPSLSPSSNTKKSILSPKLWSSKSEAISKYQLQDPGVVAGSPRVVKRISIRPSPNPAPGRLGNPTGASTRIRQDTKLEIINPGISSTKRSVPSASLWSRTSPKIPIPGPSRIPISPSTNIKSTPSRNRIAPPHPRTARHTSNIQSNPTLLSTPTIPRLRPASQKTEPPSPALSTCATVGAAPSTPIPRVQSSIPISIPIPEQRSRIPIPLQIDRSPAISICATVATAPPLDSMDIEMERELSENESIYSSASALALARYRASLPTPALALDKITSTIAGRNHELSRMSSDSSFSSASSLARHRNLQRQSTSTSSLPHRSISHVPSYETEIETENEVERSIPMSTNTTTTTTTTTEEMALVWQPDPESVDSGFDPAANLWMEIEARLNRNRRSVSIRKGKDERGQWVLTACQKRSHVGQGQIDDEGDEQEDRGHLGGEDRNDLGGEDQREERTGSVEMRKDFSEFTISAYFDPDLSTPIPSFSSHSNSNSQSTSPSYRYGFGSSSKSAKKRNMEVEETVIFNMSAPLIISNSNSDSGSSHGRRISSTPANTPLIHYETIQRVSRVRKSVSYFKSSRSGSSNLKGRRSDIGSVNMIEISSSSIKTDPSNPILSLDLDIHSTQKVPESIPMISPSQSVLIQDIDTEYHYSPIMSRLDSHVQAALEVLSDDSHSPISSLSVNTDTNLPEVQIRISPRDDTYSDAGVSPEDENESTPMPIPFPSHNTSYPNLPEKFSTYSSNEEEVGLGIGMNIHLHSTYSLPVSTPRLSRRETSNSNSSSTTAITSTSEGSQGGGYGSTDSSSIGPFSLGTSTSLSRRGENQDRYRYPHGRQYHHPRVAECTGDEMNLEERKLMVNVSEDEEKEEEEEEMLTITDLDTGYRVDLSIKRLDELWRL